MNNTRVNELDLLRFAAALSVVFFHYSFRGAAADGLSVMSYPLIAPVFKYGYLGVHFFFIISGFVILMTALNGGISEFIISRVVRLYPAYWACCTISFLIIVAIGEPRFTASVAQYLVNMTMLSGFLGVPSIDGAYWSLFVELQFYAFVVFLMALRKIQKAELFVCVWLMASVFLEILPLGRLKPILISQYAPFFAAGATFFLIWLQGLSTRRVLIIVVSWALATYQTTRELEGFERHYGTEMSRLAVAAIVTTFFIVMTAVSLRRTGFVGRTRWLMVGSITYPLYLLHQNIGYCIINIAHSSVNPHLLFWGVTAFVVVAASAVHVLIERRYSRPLKKALGALDRRLKRYGQAPEI